MRFDREQLETLVAVLDAGTFESAARRLRVTPSAVSQRIKAFERELGRVLVVRSKPVAATASGESLVRLARQLALLEHDAVDALGIDASGARGRVEIPVAVNADSMASWILPALARAAETLPVVVDLHREDQNHTAALRPPGRRVHGHEAGQHPVPARRRGAVRRALVPGRAGRRRTGRRAGRRLRPRGRAAVALPAIGDAADPRPAAPPCARLRRFR
jgi:LysR family transcriptional regulator (chromosome initiation inhibitor)